VNMTAPEPPKGFERKLAEIFPTVGPLIGQLFNDMGSAVRVTETCFRWRHTNRRFAVDFHLVRSADCNR